MDDVTPTPHRRFTALNLVFLALVGVGMLYILWRGFASESTRQTTPLFGHMSELEWQGTTQRFMLVDFADLNLVKAGDLLIKHEEVPSRIWRVLSRDGKNLLLESKAGGRVEQVSVPMPATPSTPRYVRLAPAEGH